MKNSHVRHGGFKPRETVFLILLDKLLYICYNWSIRREQSEVNMENEKVSVNINDDKLAAIDLLIDEGLVSNRSAFINEAIDLLLQKNQKTIDDIITQKQELISPNQWFIGLQSIDREYLLKFKKQNIKLSLKGFGSLYVSRDVDGELILETVEFISKRIKVHGTDEQMRAIKSIAEPKRS